MIVEVCNPVISLGVKMIRMIGILAGVAPGDMHLPRGQIDDQGRDGALTIQWIDTYNIVIADRVRQIDMILLDGLQCLDGV